MSAKCGCCACLAGAGDVPDVTNRPGLSAIDYRIGRYGTFFDAMIRRLTVPIEELPPNAKYSLHGLTTRELDDPAIALLDAWATVGDVLTFYQERIANEGFLRTATERRSILELGRLVGYTLKPGVSSTVYLAYTLDDTAKTIIPAESKSQSIPGANEQPQMFETSEDTEARGAWNAIKPRMSTPQEITVADLLRLPSIWIEGTTIRLDARDPLLFVFDAGLPAPIYGLRLVSKTVVDTEHKRTEVVLEPVRPYFVQVGDAVLIELGKKKKPKAGQPLAAAVQSLVDFLQHVLLAATRPELTVLAKQANVPPSVMKAVEREDVDAAAQIHAGGPQTIADLLAPLVKARGLAPASQWQFGRSLRKSLDERSDFVPRLLTTFFPQVQDTIYGAVANNSSGDQPYAEFRGVHVLRRRAAVFGYNAPTVLFEERPKDDHTNPPIPAFVPEDNRVLHLDTPDDAIAIGSYVITRNAFRTRVTRVLEAETIPRTAYGVSGKTTRLRLTAEWWRKFEPEEKDPIPPMIKNLTGIRNTAVLAESEELTLAQRPLDRPIGKAADPGVAGSESPRRIELDGVFDGLTPGRWVIVSGERLDTVGTSGVVSAELAMIDNVELQTTVGPGGTSYSILLLAPAGLAYVYKRDSVKIYANVLKATNGETHAEILGGGDASRGLQTFVLHHTPLTFVPAPTVAGVVSTLVVRVNDVLWHEVETLAGASPADRVFVTKTADDGKVSVTFGTGTTGARPYTGADNIRSKYRSGIGLGGNVRAGQVATAISRPLGIREVVNPLAASGGADPESRDDARRNIPVALQAMGRVVSVGDYADFARTFAGISKTSAVTLSDGRRRLVHLTIGGAGDIEIDETSDLYRNLAEALRKYGDPYQPFVIQMREKIVIAGAARVRVQPDYLWTNVGPLVRAALIETFSYDRRDFAEPVYPAEVVAAIQRVRGVAFVDLDTLGGITAADLVDLSAPRGGQPQMPTISGIRPIVPRLAHGTLGSLHAAQIAYLPAALADLFILTEITHD